MSDNVVVVFEEEAKKKPRQQSDHFFFVDLGQMLNFNYVHAFSNKIRNLKILSEGPSTDFFIKCVSWYYRDLPNICCWNFDW